MSLVVGIYMSMGDHLWVIGGHRYTDEYSTKDWLTQSASQTFTHSLEMGVSLNMMFISL